MHGCHGCQELMLEYLYDLLEGAELAVFRDHLSGCPACQATLEKARTQQQLLAVAARLQFPDVQFAAPPEGATPEPVPATPDSPVPQTPAAPPRKRRPLPWKRWAVAAGLLLALAGLAIPAQRAQRDYLAAEKTLRDREAAVADARKQLENTKEQLARATEARDRQLDEIRDSIKAREVRLVVSGPRTVQPGATTDFQVRAYDLNGQPAAPDSIELNAHIADETGRAIVLSASTSTVGGYSAGRNPDKTEEKKRSSEAGNKLAVASLGGGTYRIRIPPTLRLDPGRALNMVVAARRKGVPADKAPLTLQGKLQLTAPVYLTHLTTDKPMYQPGETVHFRSLTVDRLTLTPAAEDFSLHYTLTSPRGDARSVLLGSNGLVQVDGKGQVATVHGPDGKPIRGVGAGEVHLEPGMPGGEYTLAVSEQRGRFPPTQRKFLVVEYKKPVLDKKLDFNRSSYGLGDEVQARVTARRAGGGPVKDRPVEITCNIDDQLYNANGEPTGRPFPAQTDADGQVLVRLLLPKKIDRGQASLSVKFFDGAATETIVRTIPVVLKQVQVEFFPEGGDLVAGVSNRVYFQARTSLNKPAQLRGTLLEDDTPLSVTVATLHDDKEPGVNQGLGVFSFTPRASRKYSLRIDTPTGIAEHKQLPRVRDKGVVLSIPKGVFEPDEPIRVRVLSSDLARTPRTLMVGAYCRGQLLDTVQLAKGQTEAVLRPSSGAGGVCRVTVFEELDPSSGRPPAPRTKEAERAGALHGRAERVNRDQRALKPVAERLIYRHPRERVDVAISPDQRRYVPGQKVQLSLLTTDEKEKLKPSIVMVAVADRSVLTMADEKTARAMPTWFLLTTEVRRAEDLEYADFLIGQHPKAPEVLDLLLGTQGWRRFAEQNPDQFRNRLRKEAESLPDSDRQRQEEETERLLVMIGQSTPQQLDPDKKKIEEVENDFEDKAELLAAEHEKATQSLDRAGNDPAYKAALANLHRYQELLRRGREVAIPILSALVVLLLLSALRQKQRSLRALGYAGLVMACGLLAAVVRGPVGLPIHEPLPANEQLAQLQVPAPRHDLDGAPPTPEALDERVADLADADKKGTGGGGGLGAVPGAGLAGKPGKAVPQATMPRTFARAPQPTRATAMPKAMGGRGGAKGAPMLPMPPMAALAKADKKAAERKAEPAAEEREEAPKNRAQVFGGNRFKDLQADAMLRRRLLEGPRGLRDGKQKGKDDRGAWEPPLVVREYVHRRPTGQPPSLRTDFAETLYWHPVLVLPGGEANVSFDLCDSVTSFQVTVFAHTLDGRLGAATKTIESRLPLVLAPKVPVEVTATDQIDVALGVSNNTSENRSVQLTLEPHPGLTLLRGEREQRFDLPGDGRTRKLFRFQPTLNQGTAKVGFEGTTAPFAADGIQESIRVVADGFPVTGASSDLLEKSATHRIKLPERWISGTLQCRVDVYPSTLADLVKGLEGLLREPHGCFEQSSTSNYPNVLILDYLRTANKANPELERRIRSLLDRGYQKLTSYECQDSRSKARRGYEWFGGTAPPHEALTAYGLLQFQDMTRVYDVDKAMLQRTQDYLLAQRDGKGGFTRNQQAIDTFGRAPQHITNAYIVWALTEGSKEKMKAELDALAADAKKSDDPYYVALVALSLANRDRKKEAKALLLAIAKAQKEDGRLEAKQTSITGSGGRDLQIETTALALLGWLKTDALGFNEPIRKAVKWIGQQRGGAGSFGSTQSTILALKALISHALANKRTVQAGVVRLFLGEEKMAEQSFPAGAEQTLTLSLPNPEKHLKAGINTLRVEITGEKNIFPHTLSWSCRTPKPASTLGCPVELTTRLAKSELSEGDTVRLQVKVKNVSGAGQGMAVAIIGLPAGLNLPEDLKQLKEYSRVAGPGKRPLLGAFEIKGRELVLYWRDMAKDQEIALGIDLVARVPGIYRGPASRAYLYYNADKKHWIEPLAVTIAAKTE